MNKRITYYLICFLKLLSKPQRKHLMVYLTGLIFLVKFRSTLEIATQFGNTSVDSLQHFLNDSVRKQEGLYHCNQTLIAPSVTTSHSPLLIIDDTPSPRNGDKIEGLGVHHSASGLIKGLCAVTAVIKTGSIRFVFAIRGYRPKKSCPVRDFKSKVALAIEILKEAQRTFSGKIIVLMDSWYACAPILNRIICARWTFVAAIKKNRILEVDGRKTDVRSLAKGPRTYKTVRLSKKRKFRIAKRIVHLPKVGCILLLICKQGADTRFLITNDLKMTESEGAKLYAQRFDVEVFHKEIKQHLGFGELFMRSWQGVQTHWTLVAIAYNLITLWNGKRRRSFRQMIRHFRLRMTHKNFLRLACKFKPDT